MPYPSSGLTKVERDKAFRQRHGEKISAKKKASYAANREAICAERRTAYASDIEARRAAQRVIAMHNPEARRAARRAWYQRNAEKMRAYNAASKRLHSESTRAMNQRRRALKAAAPGTLTAEDIAAVSSAQGHRCAWCSLKRKLTVDHITPLFRGGHHIKSNIQMLCRSCNSKKGHADPIAFAQREGLLL